MEKNINIQQALFFSFLKNQAYKTKKSFNISYSIMVLRKTKLLIFLVLSRNDQLINIDNFRNINI